MQKALVPITMLQKKLIVGGIIALCVLGVGAFAYMFLSENAAPAHSLETYALQVIDACADAPYRPTCYEQEVPKLVSNLPTTEIFNVIRIIRAKDAEYLYCHVLAHELGVYEVSLDPENWLDVIAAGPTDGLCSNGFAHGAIVARFNDGQLSEEEFAFALEQLRIACEDREGFNPTDLTKAICYHGVGHVLIHMTEADVDTSLQACDQIGLKDDGRDYRLLCTEGVYMQLFQPLEPEDYALVDQLAYVPTRENIQQFCSEYSNTDRQYGACWREAWPMFGQEIYQSKGLIDYCSHLNEAQDKDLCFISAFTINGRHNLGAIEQMAATCNGMPSEYQGQCFARGANAFPEEDPNLVPQAIDMCGRADAPAAQEECYRFLAEVASFNFHPDSPAFDELCSLLPAQFESTCRRTQ